MSNEDFRINHPDDLAISVKQANQETFGKTDLDTLILDKKESSTNNRFLRISVDFEYTGEKDFRLRFYLKNNIHPGMSFKITYLSLQLIPYYLNQPVETYKKYLKPLPILDTLKPLLDNGDEYSKVNIPSYKVSRTYILYDFNQESELTGLLCKGINLGLLTLNTNNIQMRARIISNYRTSSTKTVVINEVEGKFHLGGVNDLWGLKPDEIELEDLKIELKFENQSHKNIILFIKDFELELDTFTDITKDQIGFSINGVHCRYYETYLLSDENPSGIMSEIHFKNLINTDGEIPTGLDIKPKNIKLKLYISGEDHTSMRRKLDRISNWLSPQRNKLGIPLTKEIVLDYDKDKTYDFIMQGPVKDTTLAVGAVNAEVDLIIPDGVGYKNKYTLLGQEGRNNGIVIVKPIIKITPLDPLKNIIIKDSVSDEELIIKPLPTRDWVLDCKQRRLYDPSDKNPKTNDKTGLIDIDSDWFSIKNEYDYSKSSNCVIKSVQFREGFS